MVSALVHGSSGPGLSPGRGHCVVFLGKTLYSHSASLSTQEYKWVPVNCWGNLTNCWGVTCDGLASRPGGVEIPPAASCYGNRDKLWPDEPVGSKASLTDQPVLCSLIKHAVSANQSARYTETIIIRVYIIL